MNSEKTNKELAIEFLSELLSFHGFEYPLKSLPKNTGELQLLALLNSNDNPMTSGEVATKLHAKTPRVAAILKALEEKGLIERTHPDDDKRITMISLTEKGHRKCDDNVNFIVNKITHAYDTLGKDTMNQFKDTFIELIKISRQEERKCLD